MKKSYFLISVSNRKYLDLCIKYALAGFTNSGSGAWTFVEIREGDFISFLYGAKAHNLYSVEKKVALRHAESLPPWEPITFQESGRTYSFPFRLTLRPIRKFEESLVRAEFAYVAENLLLRGGYRRTHFQADQTTLQSASQMGSLWTGKVSMLETPSAEVFIPHFTKARDKVQIPEVFPCHEFIVQSLIKQYLQKSTNLDVFLKAIGIMNLSSDDFEVLGEKAFPEGHVDILIKEAAPKGITRKIVVEVKTSQATKRDVSQLEEYVGELGNECIAGILVAGSFGKSTLKMASEDKVKLASYELDLPFGDAQYTFQKLLEHLILTVI